MSDLGIIREAIWKTAHEFGCNGDHDSGVIANALERLVINIEALVAKNNQDKE